MTAHEAAKAAKALAFKWRADSRRWFAESKDGTWILATERHAQELETALGLPHPENIYPENPK